MFHSEEIREILELARASQQEVREVWLTLRAVLDELHAIWHRLERLEPPGPHPCPPSPHPPCPPPPPPPPQPSTPTHLIFKEITMNLPDPGQTLVFTGTIQPAGAQFPAGTTFSVTSVDPNVAVSVDSTGLVVTAVIAATDTPGTVADITWQTSHFVAVPATSPTQLTATIPLTIGTPPPPPTPTPTGVSFQQSN